MEKEFIEVEYTGKLEDGSVFDTTDEQQAKENGIHNPQGKYGAVTVCLGEGHLIKGLEEELKGKDVGEYDVSLDEEKAFGKRNPKLIQLVPTSKLTKNNIKPIPGLQLNIDGMLATIKTVSGGRTIIDFNHPLAGKPVVYHIKVLKKVTQELSQVRAILQTEFGLSAEVVEKDKAFEVSKVPKQYHEVVKKRLGDFVKRDIDLKE